MRIVVGLYIVSVENTAITNKVKMTSDIPQLYITCGYDKFYFFKR